MKRYDWYRQSILDGSRVTKAFLTFVWAFQIPGVVFLFYGKPWNLINLVLFVFWSWALYPTFKSWFKVGSNKREPGPEDVDPLNDTHSAFDETSTITVTVKFDTFQANQYYYTWTVTDGGKVVRDGVRGAWDKDEAYNNAKRSAEYAAENYKKSLLIPDSAEYTV